MRNKPKYKRFKLSNNVQTILTQIKNGHTTDCKRTNANLEPLLKEISMSGIQTLPDISHFFRKIIIKDNEQLLIEFVYTKLSNTQQIKFVPIREINHADWTRRNVLHCYLALQSLDLYRDYSIMFLEKSNFITCNNAKFRKSLQDLIDEIGNQIIQSITVIQSSTINITLDNEKYGEDETNDENENNQLPLKSNDENTNKPEQTNNDANSLNLNLPESYNENDNYFPSYDENNEDADFYNENFYDSL